MIMAKYKVYVTDGRHESYDIEREMLAAADAELKVCQCVTDEDIIRECADADGILLDMAPMTEKAVNALTNCKVINRYGVGFDNVAVDACTAKGIQVTNVPDYCAEDVSDHALALIMTCLRQTALRDRLVRQGEWNIHGVSFRLTGKVLGVLGPDPMYLEDICRAAQLPAAQVLAAYTELELAGAAVPGPGRSLAAAR